MRTDIEMSWILEGRSPDQIPMVRLAEYMQQLAILLGETESVHFDRIEKACTKLVARFDGGLPAQKAQSRAYAVRERRAPADAMRAYRRLDEMVGEDRGNARLTFGSAAILRFPGRVSVIPQKSLRLIDHAHITGKLYALSGEASSGVKARIRPRDGSGYVACTADDAIGRKLGKYFLDTVRAYGRGVWTRSNDGHWCCESLHILDVVPVKDISLRDAVNELRKIEAEWPEDPLSEWEALEEKDGAA